jgi:hypothetical protein
MSGAQSYHLTNRMNRLLQCSQWCLYLLLLSLPLAGEAQSPIYQNPNTSSPASPYTVPGNPPPPIDATAFDNEGDFSITYLVGVLNPEQFETSDTLFYTNNSTMEANSPVPTNSIFSGVPAGCGFNFDYYQLSSSLEFMSDTFYNAGQIDCDSTNDGNGVLFFSGFGGAGAIFFVQTSVGIFDVSATNIYNPGTVDVGVNGLMRFTGQSADFTRSLLTIEGSGTGQNLSSLGWFGVDTNADWNPGIDLGPNFAFSSLSGINQFFAFNVLDLTNSVPYFNILSPDPSNVVSRSVFLEDQSGVNVSDNVYIDPSVNTGVLGFAAGAAHVEWIGRHVDAATGTTISNYLYLTDDYLLGASTNVLLTGGNGNVNSGLPDNFTFIASPTQIPLGVPTATSFTPFPNLFITNPYSYFNAQLIASTIDTNVSLSNPHGVLTNLPGRLQITATRALNLTLANIQGPNYMSLTATNQFDGSGGSQIDVPYADLNLGVTNGFLNISNLLAAAIPAWSGTVQGWSTRFVDVISTTNFVGTNATVSTVTNDYRVLLVYSLLSPVSAPQVQNLKLHSTNSIVISDTMNVFGSLFMDAPNLTLTTNGPGNGASSVDGELNWENTAAIGPAQVPNLLWVTNNGAIRSLGLIALGSAAKGCGAVINNGIILDQGTTVYATNFLSDGAISNGVGSFILQSQTTTLTNGYISANGNISISTITLLTSNLMLSAGKALNLTATNVLTDSDATNGNFWSVGAQAQSAVPGIYLQNGFNVPVLPTNPFASDLRHTTVTNIAPGNRRINNLWAGQDRGTVVGGFTNNVAVGHLILDASNSSSLFYFNGTGTNNAMYVDEIEFRDAATNRDGSGNLTALSFNTNVVIYYAQAIINGISFAQLLNHHNGDHLRWVPAYAGVFSSTNLVYPAGVTNTLNAALVQSSTLDSNGDGTPNNAESDPIFVPAQVNFTLILTNVPPLKARIQWDSIPASTNFVLYRTNLLSASWFTLTNFISPTNVPPLTGWPLTNVVFDTINPVQQKYYRVLVNPNTTDLYGP